MDYVLVPGTKLLNGAYTVGKVLGQGGFGITYQGSDARQLLPAAIKEFYPSGCIREGRAVHPTGSLSQGDYASLREKFLQEARVLSQFHHPGIVQVYGSFQENNTAYMAMELLRGKTLMKLIEEKTTLPPAEAVGIIRQVGEALSVVHEAGMLHRDIKPENVIVMGDGRVVLLDFGSARGFAAGQTRRMTAMVTQGYAPLEQYGQQARFGAFTDVYALGATLYHLLTGQTPVQATDRVIGVELTPPEKLNSAVSRDLNDAVMWAMEVKVDQRPQTVRDFLNVLDSVSPSSRSRGNGQTPKTPSSPLSNPYEQRVHQILAELSRPISDPPPGSADARMKEIQARLASMTSIPDEELRLCPACHQAALSEVKGEPTGWCPLCRTGKLTERAYPAKGCPVCRTGTLTERRIGENETFCPICRFAPLVDEERKRFGGMVSDLWWNCPHCRAEFDVLANGKVKLESVNNDPYGVGARHMKQTLSVEEWKKLAGRERHQEGCGACGAQFDYVGDDRLKLAAYKHDPYGVGRQHLGKTFFRAAWAKIGQGLPLNAGNCGCPQCHAEYDRDNSKRTLCLLEFNAGIYSWAAPWKGKAMPIQSWYLAIAGKQSLQPGWLCPKCKAEFDREQLGAKLIKSPNGALADAVNQTYSWEDWHRRARGIPTGSEEMKLQDEIYLLQEKKRREDDAFRASETQRRAGMETELTALFKRSVLGGYVPLGTMASLDSGERLFWMSQSVKLMERGSGSAAQWDADREYQGAMLLVTDRRILLDALRGKRWERPIDALKNVEIRYVQEYPILVTTFRGLQQAVAFSVSDMEVNATVGGQARTVTLRPNDLVELLKTLKKGKLF